MHVCLIISSLSSPVAQCVARELLCSNAYGGWLAPRPRHSVRMTYRPSAALRLLGSLRISHNKFLQANKEILKSVKCSPVLHLMIHSPVMNHDMKLKSTLHVTTTSLPILNIMIYSPFESQRWTFQSYHHVFSLDLGHCQGWNSKWKGAYIHFKWCVIVRLET